LLYIDYNTSFVCLLSPTTKLIIPLESAFPTNSPRVPKTAYDSKLLRKIVSK
jgi:hypothetical protein